MNAADIIRDGHQEAEKPTITIPKGKVLLKMKGTGGWLTPHDVHFTSQHPFQLVDQAEADVLLEFDRFEEAGRDELLAYYNKS